jgi:hypothetical protein
MLLKNNVKLFGVKCEIILAMQIVDDVYKDFEEELVITSVMDGKHSKNSLHYKGYAFDCRIWYFDKNELPVVIEEIKKRLTKEFDVVLEKDHIHIEYDINRIK